MFWPGSEAAIGGMRPHFWCLYDGKVTERGARRSRWWPGSICRAPKRVRRSSPCYFSDTDDAGHDYGPESEAVREAVMRLDGLLGRSFWTAFSRRGIADQRQYRHYFRSWHGRHQLGSRHRHRRLSRQPAPSTSSTSIPTHRDRAEDGDGWARSMRGWRTRIRICASIAASRRPSTGAIATTRGFRRLWAWRTMGGWCCVRRQEQPRPVQKSGGAHGYDPRALSMPACSSPPVPRSAAA